MTGQVLWVLSLIAGVLGLLAFTRVAADLVMMAALLLLLLTGVLEPQDALAGFANPGVMTIAALYVVAAGLRESGAIRLGVGYVLGAPRSERHALIRMTLPVSFFSAFLNNTAVVAMFLPAVQDWCKRLAISPSKMLMPLSFAAILGGTCTLIGTSTNLIVDGLLQRTQGIELGMFEIAWVGVPVALLGGLFLWLFAGRLLPPRLALVEQLIGGREYSVVMSVPVGSPLVGRSIAAAGLRNLAYGFLADVERHGRLISAVGPDFELASEDELYFVGAPEAALELRNIPGLTPAAGDISKLDVVAHQRCLVEVVLAEGFPGVGQSVKACQFRTRYQAVILAVHRGGERLAGKLGSVVLLAGDTLLLETGQAFVRHYRYRRDFLLVSPLDDSAPLDYSKALRAISILIAMMLLSAFGVLGILQAALLAAAAMLLSRCLSPNQARRAVDLNVLVIIAASLALGEAMLKSGAAKFIADGLILLGYGPLAALVAVYVLTSLFTEVITNNAAAVLMFPIASALAEQQQLSILPFAIAIMFAASASFLTPIGYQTNLMVYGPGGYRASDYLRLGLPINVLVAVVAVTLIPVIWPF